MLKPGPEVERLARNHGVSSDGAAAGRPLLDTDIRAADAIFTLSGTTNGRIATEGWDTLSKRTGTTLVELSEEEAGKLISFADTQVKPQGVITSPEWSGSRARRPALTRPFVVNVEHAKPWHT